MTKRCPRMEKVDAKLATELFGWVGVSVRENLGLSGLVFPEAPALEEIPDWSNHESLALSDVVTKMSGRGWDFVLEVKGTTLLYRARFERSNPATGAKIAGNSVCEWCAMAICEAALAALESWRVRR